MMLHTKYQGSRPCGFRQEDLFMFFPLQEVFHVYLNKFENAVTHLFRVILGNN